MDCGWMLMISWAIILYSKIEVSYGSSSILEMPSCCGDIFYISTGCTTDNSVSSWDHINDTSEVECMVSCLRGTYVTALYENSAKQCFLLRTDHNLAEPCPTGSNQVSKYSLIDTESPEYCGENGCPDGDVCVTGYVSKPFSTAKCTAHMYVECELEMSYVNMRYYWNGRSGNGENDGIVWSVTYPKIRENSGLRVIQHVNVKASEEGGVEFCMRWYLTFNGHMCTNPHKIEHLEYSDIEGKMRRGSDIDGTCFGIPEGDIMIATVIASCDGYDINDWALTGFKSPRTTIIMEVMPVSPSSEIHQNSQNCPALVSFNYQYYSWDEEIDLTFSVSSSNNSRLIKSVSYEKIAADTSLRIKYNALTALVQDNASLYHCARWYIAINGQECSPLADMLILPAEGEPWHNYNFHRRIRTIEGICDNTLSVGEHTIQVFVGACWWPTTGYSETNQVISGGVNSPSRIHVEEVRTSQAVETVRGGKSQIYRSLYGKIEQTQWWASNSEVNDGEIWSVHINKEYNETGLRVTASGDHRTWRKDSFSGCARWYFLIDSDPCTNPGEIEMVSSYEHNLNIHHPMQTSGICFGIQSGSHTVSYNVGACLLDTISEAYTGFQSSFHIIVEEVRADLVKDCGTGSPIDCDN